MTTLVDTCTTCGRSPLITTSQKRKGITGFVRTRLGLCHSCYTRERFRAKRQDAKRLNTTKLTKGRPALEEIQHQHNIKALDSYLTARRARGVSPEGITCSYSSSPSPSGSEPTPLLHGVIRKWQIRRLPMFDERAWFAFRTGHHVLWADSQPELITRIQEHMGCDCD